MRTDGNDTLISSLLCDWYSSRKRDLPWRATRDPYRIWLSEIILQQTRIAQGLPYYLDFIQTFPDVKALAEADESVILRHWQGLGYYSRARNLHRAAQLVMERFGGKMPESYEGLLSLPGIGSYTAAAIASFAYDLPQAVLDGNVYRVLARLYDLDTDILSSQAPALFGEYARLTLDSHRPALHNQAIMEFGELHCVPQNPDCASCPLADHCLALQAGTVAERPVRKRDIKRKERYFNYLFITEKRHFLIRQREGKDIWQHLWELPLMENGNILQWKDLTTDEGSLGAMLRELPEAAILGEPRDYHHLLSHQTIHARFFPLVLPEWPEALDTWIGKDGIIKISIEESENYAFSRLSVRFFDSFLPKLLT